MQKITYLILLYTSFIFSQNTPEQAAFNYFFENIVQKEYKEQKLKLKFTGNSEPSTSGLFVSIPCLNKKDNLKLLNEGFKDAASVAIDENKYNDYINKACLTGKRKKYKLSIYRYMKLEKNNLVLLSLNEKNRITKFYYFIIDENNEITDWCKTSSLH